MAMIEKITACKTVGDLKKALAHFPDSTKLMTEDGEGTYQAEIWELKEDLYPISYEEEKNNAEYEGREPDFLRVRIEEDEE
jgi:hypothetical protein